MLVDPALHAPNLPPRWSVFSVVRLLDFARTGDLGPVRVGLSKDQVRKLLGEPESVGTEGRLWFYGNLEVSFFEGVTAVIAVSLWDAPVTFPPPLSVELGPFAPGARLAAVRKALDDAAITHVIDESRTDDGAVLVAGTRVEIIFHEGRLGEMIASGSSSRV